MICRAIDGISSAVHDFHCCLYRKLRENWKTGNVSKKKKIDENIPKKPPLARRDAGHTEIGEHNIGAGFLCLLLNPSFAHLLVDRFRRSQGVQSSCAGHTARRSRSNSYCRGCINIGFFAFLRLLVAGAQPLVPRFFSKKIVLTRLPAYGGCTCAETRADGRKFLRRDAHWTRRNTAPVGTSSDNPKPALRATLSLRNA